MEASSPDEIIREVFVEICRGRSVILGKGLNDECPRRWQSPGKEETVGLGRKESMCQQGEDIVRRFSLG